MIYDKDMQKWLTVCREAEQILARYGENKYLYLHAE